MRDGNEVYVFTAASTLEKRKVQVLWRQEGTVLLSGGLKSGEKVVMSPLSAAIDGMKLRLPGEEAPAKPAPVPVDAKPNTPTAGVESENKAGSTL